MRIIGDEVCCWQMVSEDSWRRGILIRMMRDHNLDQSLDHAGPLQPICRDGSTSHGYLTDLGGTDWDSAELRSQIQAVACRSRRGRFSYSTGSHFRINFTTREPKK